MSEDHSRALISESTEILLVVDRLRKSSDRTAVSLLHPNNPHKLSVVGVTITPGCCVLTASRPAGLLSRQTGQATGAVPIPKTFQPNDSRPLFLIETAFNLCVQGRSHTSSGFSVHRPAATRLRSVEARGGSSLTPAPHLPADTAHHPPTAPGC